MIPFGSCKTRQGNASHGPEVHSNRNVHPKEHVREEKDKIRKTNIGLYLARVQAILPPFLAR